MDERNKRCILFFTRFIPDELYLRIAYRLMTGKVLHLNPPVTYNEKIQWLKLHDRRPEYTDMVDKYKVREYISGRVGSQYLVKLLGVWDKTEDIDFTCLPSQFVLKSTHDYGGIIICRDKNSLDIEKTRVYFDKHLKTNFYWQGREWPYKDVKPRILAEEYLSDPGESQLSDYKVYCFNGQPRIIQVDYDRFTSHKRQFFDCKWNSLAISSHFPSDNSKQIPRPVILEEILSLSMRLSAGIPHLRTDFYIVGDKIYVGEMTFFHGSGLGKWWPEGTDEWLGSFLDLNVVQSSSK